MNTRHFVLALLLCAACGSDDSVVESSSESPLKSGRPVKVLIITMFGGEAGPWMEPLGMTEAIEVPGLSPDYPEVHCNSDDVCLLTTGMGHANVAATMTALIYSNRFDLRYTYFLIAGIAGIDPAQGTIGTVAWARYLVDYGIAWELDAREIPEGWPYGYFGIMTKGPTEKPPLDYRTEVFQLDETLLQQAIALSADVVLEDSPDAISFRSNFPEAPANQPPQVTQCDTLAGDTWYAGNALGTRARDWVKLLTDGEGTYCTTQQEDNATYEVLKRADVAGKVDVARVAVIRAGSDFDRPYPGQSSVSALIDYQMQGGFVPATNNLYIAASPLVDEIVSRWKRWKKGVPY
jgi:purine nucleoside permease